MRALQAIFLVLLAAVMVWLHLVYRGRRSRSLIDAWAGENGYEVISAEQKFLWTGPFTARHARGQTVYRIRIRGRDGVERVGWVRCGGWFMGLASSAVTVKWD